MLFWGFNMNVLAVGCHPDDLEISCAGTLAKYVKLGHKVVMCHVANGNRGHAVIMPDELRIIRIKEAQEAGKVIGVFEVVTLDVPDLEVDSRDKEVIKALTDVIRKTKPDLIITHSPEDYMKDHLEVAQMVFDASFSASVPHYFTKEATCSKIAPIFYMDTLAGVNFLPHEYVDVTEEFEIKLRALACHESGCLSMIK